MLGDYSRGSGSVGAGGKRKHYERGYAEAFRKGASGIHTGEAGGRREGVSAGLYTWEMLRYYKTDLFCKAKLVEG